jgi:hypothetical protein
VPFTLGGLNTTFPLSHPIKKIESEVYSAVSVIVSGKHKLKFPEASTGQFAAEKDAPDLFLT